MSSMFNTAGVANPLFYFIKGQKGLLEILDCSLVTTDH